MRVEEAVARFFPAGTGYDHDQGDRLIKWLAHCGYAIVPAEQAKSEQEAKSSVLKAA